jgi:hypothetical protein
MKISANGIRKITLGEWTTGTPLIDHKKNNLRKRL